jgi:cyclic pyranopterin phosphate synthase
LRLSPEGGLYTCLFAEQGFSLRALLRSGQSDEDLTAAIVGVWQQRQDRYSEMRTDSTAAFKKVEMHYIGG